MKREHVIKILKEHHTELVQFGIKTLSLFGSVARGEEKEGSDIDFLVDFDSPATLSRYMKLKFFLEELFHCKIDLITQKGLRAELRPIIEQERVIVA